MAVNGGKAYDSELIVAQFQSKIRESGIYKRELPKIDKDWTIDNRYKDSKTRFKRFKTYYITKTAILAADEVEDTTNKANSAIVQKVTNLEATASKLCNGNSVLMANQEEMESVYKNSGVPTKINTGGSDGASVAPGSELAVYIGQLLNKRENSHSSRATDGDTNRDTKKSSDEITWWRQYKFYCAACGVNLTYGSKKCKSRNQQKDHDKGATWEKKESPRNGNKECHDHLWMQWCQLITQKVHKECGEGDRC